MAAKKPPESYPTFIVKRFEELTGAYNTLKSLVRSIEDFRREFENVTVDHADRLDVVAGAALLASDNVFTGTNTNTAQPAVHAYETVPLTNATGDGINVTLGFTTERYDQDANFDGASTFTASVDGEYDIDVGNFIGGLLSAHTKGELRVVMSNYTQIIWFGDPFAQANSDNQLLMSGRVKVNMDANDTLTITWKVSNGTKVVDTVANANSNVYLAVHLVG